MQPNTVQRAARPHSDAPLEQLYREIGPAALVAALICARKERIPVPAPSPVEPAAWDQAA